jgi:hypothetical protein
MRGWYAFDEGGKSGPGGWRHARTTWNHNVAMPHGWAIAELWLLLRDSLIFEDSGRLVLLAGIPPEWFTRREGIAVECLPTYFGPCCLVYRRTDSGATLNLAGLAAPPEGFVLRLPQSLKVRLTANGESPVRLKNGDFLLPMGTKQAEIQFADD